MRLKRIWNASVSEDLNITLAMDYFFVSQQFGEFEFIYYIDIDTKLDFEVFNFI